MFNQLPICPYGTTCYRKCKTHFDEHSHSEDYETLKKATYYVRKYKFEVYTQWLITKIKWDTDRNYKCPLLTMSRNDFNINDYTDILPDSEKVCCFEVYCNMFRHHGDMPPPSILLRRK